jgi:protein HIRA/HIR1
MLSLLTCGHCICLLSDLPIFSIDIHPDGSRFATGGQGENIVFALKIYDIESQHKKYTDLNTKCNGFQNITCYYLSVTGEDSGRIVIWNMAPVVSEKIENDENVPKMLCQMDNHLGR